jgi:hypothetical protein
MKDDGASPYPMGNMRFDKHAEMGVGTMVLR